MATHEVTINRGNGVVIKVFAEKRLYREKLWADGWDIGSKKESLYSKSLITLLREGKEVASSDAIHNFCDYELEAEWAQNLLAKGAVAYLTPQIGISAEVKAFIDTAMTECLGRVTTPEVAAWEAAEEKRIEAERANSAARAAQYQRELDNGLCPKCGTYCYGDCQAN